MLENSLNYGIPLPNKTDEETDVADSLAAGITIIDTEMKNRKDELDQHKTSSTAHSSSNISHGDGTVEAAFVEVNERIGEVDVRVTNTANNAASTAENVQLQFDRVVAEAGSNNPEVVQARGNEVNLNARLDKVDSSLAQKAAQVDVRLKAVKLGQTDMSEEFLQQMAGTTPINAVPSDGTITPAKTSFIYSLNIFNKSTAVNGYLSNVNGTVLNDANYRTSDYIGVIAGDVLNSSHNIAGYAFYNASKTFISGVQGSAITQLTIPGGTYYVRVYIYYTSLDACMLVKNTNVPSVYIPYQLKLDVSYVKNLNRNNIDKIDAQITDLVFATSKNLFDKSKVASGQYVDPASGGIAANANYFTSDYILVTSGQILTASTMRFVAFYDVNKVVVPGGLNDASNPTPCTFTVPVNAVYLRISASITKATSDNFQLENGNRATEYEAFGTKINSNYIRKVVENPVSVNLPSKLYLINGKSLNVYFDNIIHNANKYNVDIIGTKGIHYDERLGIISDFTGDVSTTFEVYDGQTFLNSKTVTLKSAATSNGSGTKKCLFIGDSTTAVGKYTQNLLNSFVGETMGIQLLGTLGASPNLHEGRSGWSTNEYTKSASLSGVTNAFWNPSTSLFDFSYYMAQQGYSSLDYVFIHLGINDIFNFATIDAAKAGIPTLLSQFDTMINSIKAYNSAIKVGVMVTIPPNGKQTGFGSAYGVGQTRWRYIAVYQEWLKQLIAKYDAREGENIYLVPLHTQLDPNSHFDGGSQTPAVHPNDTGYVEMAKPIYYFLKYMG